MRFATSMGLSPLVCGVVMWVRLTSLCRWVSRRGWILRKRGIRGCTFSKRLSRFRFELELFDHANWQTHSSDWYLRDRDGLDCRHAAASGASHYRVRYGGVSADERSFGGPWDSHP